MSGKNPPKSPQGPQSKVQAIDQNLLELYNSLDSTFDDQYLAGLYLNQFTLGSVRNEYVVQSTLKKAISDPNNISYPVDKPGGGTVEKKLLPQWNNVFNSFNNAQLTSLVPYFRVYLRNNGKVTKEIPVQNVHNKIDILKSPDQQNSLLGLKDMTISLRGDSPETRRNDIDSEITFFGNNLSIFQKNPIYQQLILPQTANSETTVVVKTGWSVPTSAAQKNLNFSPVQIAALKSQYQVYIFSYVEHSFNFNIDGSFTLVVKYVSRVDDQIKSANFIAMNVNSNYPKSNITNEKIKSLDQNTKQKIENFIKENHNGASGEAKKRIFDFFASQKADKLDAAFDYRKKLLKYKSSAWAQGLLKGVPTKTVKIPTRNMNCMLLEHARRHVGASRTRTGALLDPSAPTQQTAENKELLSLKKFFSEEQATSFFESPPGKKALYDAMKTRANVSAAVSQASNVSGRDKEDLVEHKYIKYTSLAGLISGFINANAEIKKKLKQENIKIVFGGATINNGPVKDDVPLGGLPITFNLIREVILEEYVSKVKTKITLMGFISAVLKKVKKYYFQGDPILESNKKEGGNIIRTLSFVTTAGRFKGFAKQGSKQSSIRGGNRDSNKLVQVYFISMGPASDEDQKLSGAVDNYVAGSPNSVVKGINFTQSNLAVMQAIRDDNIVNAFRDGKSLQILPQMYNVDMKIVGNINFLPGYTFNLFPTSIGLPTGLKGSVMETLGILGTYMTIKVEHKIGLDGFTTRLSAYNLSTKTYIKKELSKKETSAVVTKVSSGGSQ